MPQVAGTRSNQYGPGCSLCPRQIDANTAYPDQHL